MAHLLPLSIWYLMECGAERARFELNHRSHHHQLLPLPTSRFYCKASLLKKKLSK